MIVKEGSRWTGGDFRKAFLVLHTIEQEGQVWVHYRDEGPGETKEYSCYLESFLQRFSKLPE